MYALDLSISQLVFSFGQTLPHSVVVFIASYLIWLMVVILFLLLKRAPNARGVLFQLLAASALAYLLNAIIGFLISRDRPFISFPLEAIINTAHLNTSFPSDHAAIAAALAVGYSFFSKKSIAFFAILALAISFGRVLAGVHFVGDVVFGMFIGSFAAFAVYYLYKKISVLRGIFLE